MPDKYICNYLHNSGEICGCGCHRPEGCHEYWRCKKHIPCKVCGKPTGSVPETCKIHAGDFYIKQFYTRQLSKKTSSHLNIV